MNVLYDKVSTKKNCVYDDSDITNSELNLTDSIPEAPFGRTECDPPSILAEALIKVMKEQEKPDLILLPGDFVMHGVSLKPEKGEGNYTLLKDIISEVTYLLE